MIERSENNNESQIMETIDYGDQVLLEKYNEYPRIPSRDINSHHFLIYNAPPAHWARDPKAKARIVLDILTNPNRTPERNNRKKAIHNCIGDDPFCLNLTYAIRRRHNSLGREATDEERNDPHAIGLLMLRYGASLFRTNQRLSRRLGLIHPSLPSGRVGFYAQQRFGRNGGELQDLWYSLYVLRTELDHPGLRAIAEALHYAHICGPNERDLEED